MSAVTLIVVCWPVASCCAFGRAVGVIFIDENGEGLRGTPEESFGGMTN
ncbi:hypothetical protein ACLBYB_28455 [Methylobacterium sp. D54C]